ncbi:outer membrane protein [Neotabrizicola sp. VNH66]|uniref:outer membrane protein n=1 Tax=Neotabrizicola sp. VNH66 TaxID=3400918 RepID=UPI003C003289
MKRIALILAASGALAAPALAGGPTVVVTEPEVVPAPAPVIMQPQANWGGFYGGVQLGYGDADAAGNKGNGGTYGVQAGYRWDLGQTVLGVEGEYNKAGTGLTTAGDELDSVTRLKLQAGYDLGRTLVYATAGAAHAKATLGGSSLSENGWTIGAGLDYAVTDNWTIGGEILADKFDNFGGSGVDLDNTSAALRINYKF